MSGRVGAQDSGGPVAIYHLRNLSTERKAIEMTLEIINFKRALQAHVLPFQKVFQRGNTAVKAVTD